MSAIYEFFLCPIHGILAPANWPLLLHTFAMARPYLTFWRKR